MTDRNTKIAGSQIKNRSVTKAELDATSETTEKILVVQSDGSVDWQFNRSLSDYKKLEDNIMLTAFRLAVVGSLTQFNMIDGIVDEYEDQSGINTGSSTNEYYDSTIDSYEPATDTVTKLLIHANGTDGSTSFPDSSPSGHTITASGNAQVDTAQYKYGGASALFDGTSDYLSIPDSSDFDLSSGDWTIDCWVRMNSTASKAGVICSQYTDASNFISFDVETGTNLTNLIYMQIYSAGSRVGRVTSTSLTLTTGVWYHIAFVRTSGTYKCFLNGTDVTNGSTLLTGSPGNYTSVLRVGAGRDIGSLDYWNNGWIDDFRLTKGLARWTSNFTPSDVELAPVENMTLISNSFTADAEPSTARIILLEEDITALTLNTDLIVYASKNGGSTWASGTLIDDGDYDASKRVLTADITLVGTGTSMQYKIVTANNKDVRLHGASLNWD